MALSACAGGADDNLDQGSGGSASAGSAGVAGVSGATAAGTGATKTVVGTKVPIPLHETGTIPQPSAMFLTTAPWVAWNVWAGYQNTNAEGYTWNTPDSIKMAHSDAHTVTRESLPSLK